METLKQLLTSLKEVERVYKYGWDAFNFLWDHKDKAESRSMSPISYWSSLPNDIFENKDHWKGYNNSDSARLKFSLGKKNLIKVDGRIGITQYGGERLYSSARRPENGYNVEFLFKPNVILRGLRKEIKEELNYKLAEDYKEYLEEERRRQFVVWAKQRIKDKGLVNAKLD